MSDLGAKDWRALMAARDVLGAVFEKIDAAQNDVLSYDSFTDVLEALFDAGPEDFVKFQEVQSRIGDSRDLATRYGDMVLGAWISGWRPPFGPQGQTEIVSEEGSAVHRLALRHVEFFETQDLGEFLKALLDCDDAQLAEAGLWASRGSPEGASLRMAYFALGAYFAGWRPGKEGTGAEDGPEQDG